MKREKLNEYIYNSLLIFGLFGSISVLVDVDNIWKMFGVIPPINLTIAPGRELHTPLIFLLYVCIFSIIVVTPTFRQRLFGRFVGLHRAGIERLSASICDTNLDDYDDYHNFEYYMDKEGE